MPNTKLGTSWIGKGKGATIDQLSCALDLAIEQGIFRPRFFAGAFSHFRKLIRENGQEYKTNLALTGEPLTDEDLRRIAECE